jgi:AcrR family transcriptional regulator
MASLDGSRVKKSARFLRNQEALRQSALQGFATKGWDNFTLHQAALNAGLTVGVIRNRYESKAELGIDLWESMLAPKIEQLLKVEVFNIQQIHDFLATAEGTATIEIVMAAKFDEELHAVVIPSLLRLGSAIKEQNDADRLSEIAFVLAGYVAYALPKGGTRKSRIQVFQPSDSDDASLDNLLNSSLELIGKIGYRNATVMRLAKAANVTTGSIFPRFATKAELIATATSQCIGPISELSDELSEQDATLLVELVRQSRWEPQIADALGNLPKRHQQALGATIFKYFL